MAITLTSSDNNEARGMAKLRRMLALSSTFATLVSSYSDRFNRVWYEGSPSSDLARREQVTASSSDLPFASIWPHGGGYVKVADGSQAYLLPRGMFHVYLMCPRSTTQTNWNDARLEFVRFSGNWIADVVNLFGADDTQSDGTPAVSGEGHFWGSMVDAMPPEHVAQEVQKSAGDFFFRHYAFSYGDDVAGGV
jgi:hypothetical protein